MKKLAILSTLLFSITFSFSQSAKKLVKTGITKLQKEDYKGAIDDYTKAIEVDSNYADAYYYRGYAKFTLKDYQGAIIDYTKNVELDPKSYDGFIDRGDVKYILKDYKGAIDDFSSSLELYSTDYETYFKRGLAKYDTAGYRAAIDDFSSAINLNPYNKFDFENNYKYIDTNDTKQRKMSLLYNDALYYRGLSKKNIKNNLEAIIDFTQVLEFNVNVFFSRKYIFNIKGLYQYTGYYLPDFLLEELAAKSWPNLINALYYRGQLNHILQKYKEAVADLSNVIKLNPKYAYAYYYRGLSNYILKDYSNSSAPTIEDFSKFIALDSSLASAYYYRGMISRNWGRRNPLENYYDFTKAIKLDPNFAEAHFERGVEMFKVESLPNRESFSMDEINANYTKAIELKPNYPEAYFHRGIAKSNFFKKDYTGAIEDYTKAIDLNPNFVDAYYNRGNTYYRIRKNKEACLDLKKTAELGKPYVYDLIKEYCK
jgi:tetratricopeptide (TPR) repeat protein